MTTGPRTPRRPSTTAASTGPHADPQGPTREATPQSACHRAPAVRFAECPDQTQPGKPCRPSGDHLAVMRTAFSAAPAVGSHSRTSSSTSSPKSHAGSSSAAAFTLIPGSPDADRPLRLQRDPRTHQAALRDDNVGGEVSDA